MDHNAGRHKGVSVTNEGDGSLHPKGSEGTDPTWATPRETNTEDRSTKLFLQKRHYRAGSCAIVRMSTARVMNLNIPTNRSKIGLRQEMGRARPVRLIARKKKNEKLPVRQGAMGRKTGGGTNFSRPTSESALRDRGMAAWRQGAAM